MKSLILFGALMTLGAITTRAQNTFPATGKTGIGTSTPTELLHVNGGNIKLTNPATYPYGYNMDLTLTGGWVREYSFSYNGKGKMFSFGLYGEGSTLGYGFISGNTAEDVAHRTPWMTFKPTGRIGINTLEPNAQLEITGGPVWTYNSWKRSVRLQDASTLEFAGNAKTFAMGASGNKFYLFRIPPDGNSYAQYFMVADGNTGNVVIGDENTDFVAPMYKLAVNGAIGARKVRVQQGAWADHVFYDDYKLPTLAAMEQFIKKNKHLEGIPSTAEVQREGIDLGEMNKLLLQKIEELTLHVIELNKKVEVLQQQQK